MGEDAVLFLKKKNQKDFFESGAWVGVSSRPKFPGHPAERLARIEVDKTLRDGAKALRLCWVTTEKNFMKPTRSCQDER
jgi:hypothetical protein